MQLSCVARRRVRHEGEVLRRVRRRRPRHPADGRPGVRAAAENDQRVPEGAHLGLTGVRDHVRVLPRVQVPGRAERTHPVQGGDLPTRVSGPLSDGRSRAGRSPAAAAAATAPAATASAVRAGGPEGPADRPFGLRAVGRGQHGPAERPGPVGDTLAVRRPPQQAAAAAKGEYDTSEIYR